MKKIEDESKIIRKPNFELQPSLRGIPNRRLIIFYPDDRNLVYQYYYTKDGHQYRCWKCDTKKHPVIAKLHINDQTEKYVVMGKEEHICEPLKYQPYITIDSANYIILNKESESKETKIITFTSSTQKFCYEFSFFILKNVKRFRCHPCFRLKKNVYAKIIADEEGKECIHITDEHICEPLKYQPKKCETKIQPKKIRVSLFQFCPNLNGKENGILQIFTSEKKDFVFSYAKHNSTYVCNPCGYQKVNVKIIKDEKTGEIYAELFGLEHVCTPKKYVPFEKDVEAEIILESKFTFSKNSRGKKN
uniref:Uncharacterized protein n=1 Tax=Panagrolaimus sp. ES5 TaxID=591445 RepID=A0AC34FJR5_9BILA